jgi:hypothetical protein
MNIFYNTENMYIIKSTKWISLERGYVMRDYWFKLIL